MTKHVRKSRRRQAVERPPAATVRIPLPVLGAFARIERSYFELCIRAGQQVLDAMMEQDRTALCGPRWKRDPDRQAGRAGTTPSEGTLGGRRIQLTRPRVRSQSEQEVELPGFAFASHRDPLAHHATRGSSLPDRADRWDRPGRPLGRGRARHRCRGQEAGAGAAGRPHRTQPRRQGTAARPRRARVGSGTRARLFVVDGAKALTSAIHTVFGTLGTIQRCQLRKRRNILGHLPDHLHANVTAVLREAWAAASVREGLADTLTLQRFGIAGVLYTKLRTTKAIENFNGAIATYSRNVKRWRSGTMVVRWVSAAIVEAEKKFRRVHGWPDITKVISALGQLEAKKGTSTERVA